jgi:glutamate formiminotransferase / 5-formyltetrahydrofolate cyclo-ligase
LFECVVNVAEGRRLEVLDRLSDAAGATLRDRHHDGAHNRSVFTLIGGSDDLTRDVRSLATAVFDELDLRHHEGVHPRLGVLDVVPFVALPPDEADRARGLRDDTARWIAESHEVPAFLYGELPNGTSRTLPEVRRGAFRTLAPDFGPPESDPRLGASAVGARGVLVAWNLWVTGISLSEGRAIAVSLRRDEVRALAFPIGDFVQISVNLIEPTVVGPGEVYDRAEALLPTGAIDHAELVGLVPDAVLRAERPERWAQLGLSEGATIEARLN